MKKTLIAAVAALSLAGCAQLAPVLDTAEAVAPVIKQDLDTLGVNLVSVNTDDGAAVTITPEQFTRASVICRVFASVAQSTQLAERELVDYCEFGEEAAKS